MWRWCVCVCSAVVGSERLRPLHRVHRTPMFPLEQTVLPAGRLRGTLPAEVVFIFSYLLPTNWHGSGNDSCYCCHMRNWHQPSSVAKWCCGRSPSSLVCGQLLTIWNIVWRLPHWHLSLVARPQFFVARCAVTLVSLKMANFSD